jgi:hypothetical protein
VTIRHIFTIGANWFGAAGWQTFEEFESAVTAPHRTWDRIRPKQQVICAGFRLLEEEL